MSKDAVTAADDTPLAPYKNPVEDLINVLPPGLTSGEIEFIYCAEILGLPVRAAAARAKMPISCSVAPHIVQARDLVRRAVQNTMVITKADIVNGYQEAIHMAKLQGDALTMMIGWEKTSKTLGLDAPVRVDVNLHASMEALQKNVRGLTDDELMRQVGGGSVIDAEFYEVKPDGQD